MTRPCFAFWPHPVKTTVWCHTNLFLKINSTPKNKTPPHTRWIAGVHIFWFQPHTWPLTLFAEFSGRGTGERQTVPQKAERTVLLEAALETLEVAFNCRRTHTHNKQGRLQKESVSHTGTHFHTIRAPPTLRALFGVGVARKRRLTGVWMAVPYSMSSSVCLLFFRCYLRKTKPGQRSETATFTSCGRLA